MRPYGQIPWRCAFAVTSLLLRKEDAAHIHVRDVHDAHDVRRVNPGQTQTDHPGKGESRSFRPRATGRVHADDAPLTFALAGNQNCGKTTLFNQLTGSNQHVGNFPGVTVSRKDGAIRKHENAMVIDFRVSTRFLPTRARKW